MNDPARIYCIIATYNAERWIDKCLNSAFASTILMNTVVIDNHSADRTVDIIKSSYPQVILIESEKNLGFGKANNIGIKLACNQGADYFFLLNQDAWIEPETVNYLVEKHKQHPEYGILSPMHLFDATKLDWKFKSYLKGMGDEIIHNLSTEISGSILPVRFVNAAMWLISRQCIETVGLFAPIFDHYGEDQDFVHRCKFHHFNIGICLRAIGYHEREQSSPKEKDVQFNKLLERDKSFCLSILLNLNHIYLRQWIFLLVNSIKEFILSIVLLKFKRTVVILHRVAYVPINDELNNQRKEMKMNGAFFNN